MLQKPLATLRCVEKKECNNKQRENETKGYEASNQFSNFFGRLDVHWFHYHVPIQFASSFFDITMEAIWQTAIYKLAS
jgi:hypothetical protein